VDAADVDLERGLVRVEETKDADANLTKDHAPVDRPGGCGCCPLCGPACVGGCCDECVPAQEAVTRLDSEADGTAAVTSYDGAGHTPPTPKAAEPDEGKRDVPAKERKELAREGEALPDGSFPIANVQDLKNAIRAVGRAKDPAAAKAHIKRRAKALGQSKLIPDTWKAAATDGLTHDPADIQAVQTGLVRLVIAELEELDAGEDELWDISALLQAVSLLRLWWEHEAMGGETVLPDPDADDASDKSVDPDVTKAAVSDMTADLVKTAAADAVKPLAETIEKLVARLETVEKFAAPGGPVRTRTNAQSTTSATRDRLEAQEAYYRKLASQAEDATLRKGYLELADEKRGEMNRITSAA